MKDLEELPNSFAIKTNNGSGTNKIVFDKSNEDLKDIVKIMNRYRKKEYGYKSYEMFYNMIKPMIVAEKLLLTKDGQPPYDYKIHCFKQKDGKFKHFIQVDYDRFTDHGRNIYDEKWNLEPYTLGFKTDSRKIKKPKNFKKMLELADKLAVDFDYVRVDFYLVDKQIFFGELTFAHGSGFEEFAPEKYDKLWGGYWNQEI